MPTACRCSSSTAACAITQTVIGNQLASYGLSHRAARCPAGPVTVMVHMASVWVPFTSESKEAIAGYPEIQKELRLGLQAVGRKLGMYLRRRQKVKQEGERRNIFLRYLGEVATAVSEINDDRPRSSSTSSCCEVAKKQDRRGRHQARRPRQDDRSEDDEDFGENVLIVEPNGRHRTAAAASRSGINEAMPT